MLRETDLTKDQKRARLHILRGKDAFLSGSAGTGKSALLQLIISDLQQQGKSVLVCAPTGTAALNIGGVTIHHAFGFPIGCCVNSGNGNRGMSIRTRTSGVVKKTDVLIVDEVSMVRMDLFDAMMASITKIEEKQNRHIQLILVGDFFQLPPVLMNNSTDKGLLENYYKQQIGYGYAFQGTYWNRRKFYPIILKDVIRQNDLQFIQALNKLRCGDEQCIDYFNQHCNSEDDDAIYLYAYKRNVDRKNLDALNAVEGDLVVSKTKITYKNGYNSTNVDTSLLNAVPKDLALKSNIDIIITENDRGSGRQSILYDLDNRFIPRGQPLYINGSKAWLQQLEIDDEGNVEAAVIVVNGKLIELEPVTYPIYDYGITDDGGVKRILVAEYTQLPIKVAYATTIHSSQGLTFDSANIDPATFCPGQLYVAISRVRQPEGLHLLRRIVKSDLKVDPLVVEFYDTLEKIIKTGSGRKMGRPPKNENGEIRSKLIWIPKPLEKHVRNEISQGRPLQIKNIKIPRNKSDRVHMRVPESLYIHIKDEIKEWKSTIKKLEKRRNANKKR